MKNRLNLLHLRLLALFGAFALAVASFIAYLHDDYQTDELKTDIANLAK